MELTQKAFLARHSGSMGTGCWGLAICLRGRAHGVAGAWPSAFGEGLHFPCGPSCARFPGGTSSKEPSCQCRRQKRHGFDPWVRKIP